MVWVLVGMKDKFFCFTSWTFACARSEEQERVHKDKAAGTVLQYALMVATLASALLVLRSVPPRCNPFKEKQDHWPVPRFWLCTHSRCFWCCTYIGTFFRSSPNRVCRFPCTSARRLRRFSDCHWKKQRRPNKKGAGSSCLRNNSWTPILSADRPGHARVTTM